MPNRPVAELVCRDVLFAHWPIDADYLRSVVPSQLTIETFDGTAWVGIIVVDIAEAHVQRLPVRPSLSSINLRTYVSLDGESGVYFISLEVDERFSAWIARNGFGVPYNWANINLEKHDGEIQITSQRRDRRTNPARFEATYRPNLSVEPAEAPSDSIEEFLIERSNYYFAGGPMVQQTAKVLNTIESEEASDSHIQPSDQPVFVGTVSHGLWPLQPVEASVIENTLLNAVGISMPDSSPIYHYSRQQHMAAERIRRAVRT